jgi:hypothetical protein
MIIEMYQAEKIALWHEFEHSQYMELNTYLERQILVEKGHLYEA